VKISMPVAGRTAGVGMPIIVTFARPVADTAPRI